MSWEFLAANLPHVTAALNLCAIGLLVAGLVKIKQKQWRKHRNLMIAAVVVSGLFLAAYLLHKVALQVTTGEPNKKFPVDAPPAARIAYFAILIPHLLLAMAVPVLALRAVYLAYKRRIVAHKRLVRYAYPIWMYVSVTGVLVYLMLYQWFPA
ncbi:DUF420 domain-containing protein [Crateriforma conspicua]|uniref:DUF420 domain-containing protein n=1 Tax=Crateriforma conspicua TaxID=2527996 RepID=A0A5C5Y7H7_9PLAN|nr:DUF420 domain-containing protein [Crateriforma conspicua]TWT71134.1 hypothetical protein Pan14r_34440 [Crateriforma conspicua]